MWTFHFRSVAAGGACPGLVDCEPSGQTFTSALAMLRDSSFAAFSSLGCLSGFWTGMARSPRASATSARSGRMTETLEELQLLARETLDGAGRVGEAVGHA